MERLIKDVEKLTKEPTGIKDADGKMINKGDVLSIRGQYTGEVIFRNGRWIVAVETLRFLFPMTILPLDVAVNVYKAKVKQ